MLKLQISKIEFYGGSRPQPPTQSRAFHLLYSSLLIPE